MPYIMSKDSHRSLKMDFPNLRELQVRFRSAKWQHALPPEANMKIWSEDTRLDELIDGLRNMFLPDTSEGPKSERELESYISNNPSAYPSDPGDPSYTKQWLEIHKARNQFAAKRAIIPKIKVVCACRVHGTHFNALTMPAAPQPDLAQPNNGTGVIQQTTDRSYVPVREGEPVRGFTPIDLQQSITRLYDPDAGSANVARTCHADKDGVLLALEIHCLDPKRDAPGPL